MGDLKGQCGLPSGVGRRDPRMRRTAPDGTMHEHRGRDRAYVMRRSADETWRLQDRAKFFEPLTRHLFEDAGIRAGMRVLDIGSGAGDVSLLVGELVGRTGSVLGGGANPEMARTGASGAEGSGSTTVVFRGGATRERVL